MVLISIVSGVCGPLKVWFIGGDHEKLIYRRESPKKEGKPWTVYQFKKGSLVKKEGEYF